MTAAQIQFALQIAPEHTATQGHFPGNAILPGAVLLNEVVLALQRQFDLPDDQLTVQAAKFPAPARGGDRLEIAASRSAQNSFKLECRSAHTLVLSCAVRFGP